VVVEVFRLIQVELLPLVALLPAALLQQDEFKCLLAVAVPGCLETPVVVDTTAKIALVVAPPFPHVDGRSQVASTGSMLDLVDTTDHP
jgi:hypothetical protein